MPKLDVTFRLEDVQRPLAGSLVLRGPDEPNRSEIYLVVYDSDGFPTTFPFDLPKGKTIRLVIE